MPVKWEVLDEYDVKTGPYEEDVLVATIERGVSPHLQVRPAGSRVWTLAADTPPFASAVRRMMAHRSPWMGQGAAAAAPALPTWSRVVRAAVWTLLLLWVGLLVGHAITEGGGKSAAAEAADAGRVIGVALWSTVGYVVAQAIDRLVRLIAAPNPAS